ncbi:M28 family peptidase [Maribacter chungangensis]|uniref:M28 family peptidase n=1 Tax=Maribacter chungangensis TaxID=1069117 RepID=A0ABW3AZZ5_9FLAO
MKKNLFLIGYLFVITLGCSQEKKPTSVSQEYFDIIRPAFMGNLAYETTEYVAQFWRVAGNTGFNKSVYWIAEHLEKAGYVLEDKATTADRLTYRMETRAMEHPTWEPVSASLQIAGEGTPLLVSDSNPNMTYLNSASTPKEGVTAEVIHLKNASELSKYKVKGKIVYIAASARRLVQELMNQGALGVITYNNPDYLQPEKNTTSIQFRSLPPDLDSRFWGIALSYAAKKRLESALAKGKLEVLVNIQTKRYTSEELTVVANIKGAKLPKERLVFSAHVQEPGANDNASGVGAQLEMATLAAELLKTQKISLDRTLTFLWGDEIISTRRYIQEDKERAKDIKWGISLDMVGENTAITGGSFLIEKMPDPSAIWTRGNDKHSEWGGEVLSLEAMTPHYLNDFMIENFKNQGAFANWEVNTNPFEGGSDHTPFLHADIPGLLLWHFTDQFYHTDRDTIDKVSQETLKNVGTGALASAFTLVNADSATAEQVLNNIVKVAEKRLKTEFDLSRKSIKNSGALNEEIIILKAWEDWYSRTMMTVMDLEQQPTKELKSKILQAQKDLTTSVSTQIEKLKYN